MLESQLSRLGSALSADVEKSKAVLKSHSEGIPPQIHQDLAAACLELGPSFAAVSQMCTKRSRSLIEAMESGRVRTYHHFKND